MRNSATTIFIALTFFSLSAFQAMASGPAKKDASAKASAEASHSAKSDGKKTLGEEAGKKSKDKEKARVISTSPSYIGLDPIYTTILDGDVVVGTLMLGIGLDVPDQKLHDEIVQTMPRLRDLYLRSMLAYTSSGVRTWRQPDAEEIAARLQAATERHYKKKGVKVLLAQLAMRLNH